MYSGPRSKLIDVPAPNGARSPEKRRGAALLPVEATFLYAYTRSGDVREALEAVFRENPQARAYVLDEQGAVRPHMVVFVDGHQVRDRQHLSDPVPRDGEIYVAQALSGG